MPRPARRQSSVSIKARLNLKLDRALKDWIMAYAQERGTTVSNLIRDYFAELKQHETLRAEGAPQI